MSLLQVQNWSRQNRKAMQLYQQAFNEYAAFRCSFLNRLLIGGATLALQVIEKVLKCGILLKNPEFNIKKINHSLKKNTEEFDKYYSSDSDIKSRFQITIDKISGFYQSRYPDNPDTAKIYQSSDIDEIDEMYFDIIDILSKEIPDEVHFRNYVFTRIFDIFQDGSNLQVVRNKTPESDFICTKNKAFGYREKDYANKFLNVFIHLYF